MKKLAARLFFSGAFAVLLTLHGLADTVVAPAITTQPASLIVTAGSSATFSVVATGTTPLQYQWFKDGREISHANSATLSFSNPRLDDAAVYTVRIANGAGSLTSSPATLTVNSTAGLITTAPTSATANAGTEVKLTVTTTGSALAYQWKFNGRTLKGATGASLTLANAGTTVSGYYEVTVLSRNAPVAASAARVVITTEARITNIATRGYVGVEDDEILIAGLVTRGTGDKKVLLRAVGPTLGTAPYNVTGALAKPRITLYRGSTQIATNAGWGGTAALSAAFNQVGAFSLPTDSSDAALLQTVPGGVYTAHVTGPTGAHGIALIEVYDADPSTPVPAVELANISTRAMVGAVNDGALIAGFVISGTTSDTVLVRGVSQSMGTLHGMRRALGNSQVTVYDAKGKEVAANAIWGKTGRGNPNDDDDDDKQSEIDEASDRTGAFRLPHGSTDSALVVTLAPGAYTAVVTGRNNSSGVALVEIYEVH